MLLNVVKLPTKGVPKKKRPQQSPQFRNVSCWKTVVCFFFGVSEDLLYMIDVNRRPVSR